MRVGTLWQVAVLASLALLASGQLCMLTTCVPRLSPRHAIDHSCCRALPGAAASGPARGPAAPGGMPCDQVMHTAAAPTLSLPSASVAPASLIASFAALLARRPPAWTFRGRRSTPDPRSIGMGPLRRAFARLRRRERRRALARVRRCPRAPRV